MAGYKMEEMSRILSKLNLMDKAAVSLENPDEYVLHMDSQKREDTSGSALIACSSSDHTVRFYSRDHLVYNPAYTIKEHTQQISGIKFCRKDSNLLYTASLDGTLRSWDLRTGVSKAVTVLEGYDETNNVFTSFDLSCDGRWVCAGTEAVKDDVHIIFWDVRKATRLGVYSRSHQDDVTQVCFHPTKPSVLLTGSMDGLLCVFDVSQPDEEEAITATLNTESTVSRAGWCSTRHDQMYGITHTNELQVWDSEFDLIQDVSDINEASSSPAGSLRMDYLVDCFCGEEDDLFLLAGTHRGDLSIYQVSDEGVCHQVSLSGGHSDVVRCLSWDKHEHSLVTGGEDTLICKWSPEQVKSSSHRDSHKAKSALKMRHAHRKKPHQKAI